MKRITFLFVLFSLLTYITFGQTTWYVSEDGDNSTGNGSTENPWATISYALADAGVSDGDIIKVEGTITEDGIINDGIVIDKNITIKGEKYFYSVIEASDNYETADRRVFTVNPGITADFIYLEIRNGNNSGDGGGIGNYGNTYFEDCRIYDNISTGSGGGIISFFGSSLSINNSSIYNNSASHGGAVRIDENNLKIENSTFYGNTANEGGALYLCSSSATANDSLINVTFYDNSATGTGGALYFASFSSGVISTVLINTTFSEDNAATGDEIYVYSDNSATLNLTNTILSNSNSDNYSNSGSGIIVNRQYTICSDASLPVSGTGNSNNTDALLFALADNGGLTPTCAIASNSPAKNSGTSSGVPDHDQRGAFRESVYDIGSYEYITQLAGDFTINNTNPTDFPAGTNFNSFEDAINALNFGGIADEVNFMPVSGQIFEEPPLIIYTGGTADMLVKFWTFGPPAVVKGTGGVFAGNEPSSESDMILVLQETDYITIESIDFMDNESNSTPEEKMEMGIVLFGTEHITIQECSISLTADESMTMGIVIVSEKSSSNDNLIDGNSIQNCTIGIGVFGDEDITSENNQITGNFLSSLGNENSPYAVGISAENQSSLLLIFNSIDGLIVSDVGFNVGISVESSEANILDNTISNIEGGTCLGMQLNTGTYEVLSNNIGDISSEDMAAGIYTESSDCQIQINTISNLGPAPAVIGIRLNGESNTCDVYDNTISELNASTFCVGIGTDGDNNTYSIYNNEIHSITNSDEIIFIAVSADASDNAYENTNNIYRNKIHDIEITAGNGTIIGIATSVLGTHNIYNNLIYDLKNPNYNETQGIAVAAMKFEGGTNNVFYNTAFLDYNSAAANNANCLILVQDEDAILQSVDMRNNIFVNNTDITTGNLAIGILNITSGQDVSWMSENTNNNLYFIGIEGGSLKQPVYFDGINFEQTLSDYQTYIQGATGYNVEDASMTENPPFLGIEDFNINPEVETAVESAGIQITSPFNITTDIDNKLRWGETGYLGGGTAPDIGAYEKYEPIVITADADNITTTTATLNGTVLPNGIDISDIVFEYGTAPDNYTYTITATPSTASGNDVVDIKGDITGLEILTTYYFRIKASVGELYYVGDEFSFTSLEVSIDKPDNYSVTVYPNPTTGILTISTLNDIQKITVSYLTGKVILNKQYTKNNQQMFIDFSEYGKGIYFINIKTNNNSFTEKVIVY